YIIGGLLKGWTEVSSKNEVYDPLTDTWEEMAPIPVPKHNYATVVYNDKIYIFGGDTQNGNNAWVQTATVEVYDPATNTWDTSISLPTVRFNPGIGLINHSIIITGGISGDGAVTDVDIFDLVSNSWSQGDSLPLKNVAMGSATLNDKIYIIGGADGPGDWIGYNEVYEGAFEEPSGTAQNTNTNELIVFPNPAKNYIQIYERVGNAKFKGFQILTIEGKAIKEGRLASNRIDVSDLRKGVFLLKIETDKRTITKRIIIE
ncbi:MAG: T9SS type A sorting domain-containing protein, partial [Bacteroidetes bacterium]|nr:T9SS type A sorting domain-containing protein [Bacteroidota bacterium]